MKKTLLVIVAMVSVLCLAPLASAGGDDYDNPSSTTTTTETTTTSTTEAPSSTTTTTEVDPDGPDMDHEHGSPDPECPGTPDCPESQEIQISATSTILLPEELPAAPSRRSNSGGAPLSMTG